MKRNFVKGMSFVLAAVLGAGMLSACGGDKEQASENDGLTVINIWTGDTGSKLQYEEAIAEFNENIGKKEGIKVVYEAKENLGQTMTVALQTKQAPELFMTGSVAEYSEQGYITPIDDLPGGKELIESKKEYLIEGKQQYNGKTYSIPYAANTYGLIYNKDMFKEAGIVDENGEAKPPTTLKEVREYAKKLTDSSKGKYGIILPMKWSGMFDVDLMNAAVAITGSSGYNYATGKFDYSCTKEILNLMLQLKEDKSIMPGAEGLDNDPARSRFAEGNIGMKFAVSWDVGVLNKQFPAKCDWGVVPYPVGESGQKHYGSFAVNTGLKISADAPDKVGADKLMTVYKYYVGDEMAKKIFELGAALPLNADVIDQVDSESLPKGWKEFAELIKISKISPRMIQYDISGQVKFADDFTNNVWTGKKTVDQAIEDANKVYNDGIDKYFSIHPDEDRNQYIVPGYSRARD